MPEEDSLNEKISRWEGFYQRIQALERKGKKGIRELKRQELQALIDENQALASDLARARSMEAPRTTVDRLNRMAVAAHMVLYGAMRESRDGVFVGGFGKFARTVRLHLRALGLASAMLFIPALISFFAVQWSPALSFELVPESFLEYDPAKEDNLHDIPSLARPIASTSIIGNNIQVTILAFGLGLTAGIGTTWILVFNGVHIGAVVGWFTMQGKWKAIWGWIMPHGGTELLAICLSGAAGYLLAGAILNPGLKRRAEALKAVGGKAMTIEVGCMVMLLIAGLIEGFVSPSGLPFGFRIVFLSASLLGWFFYFLWAGRKEEGES